MSNSSKESLTCPNPDCRIAETGKCVEGFEIGDCPHQRAGITAPETLGARAKDEEPATESSSSDVLVASGDILTIDEATDVLRQGPARVLAMIGPIKSGKTTFGVSLYDSFQSGPFDRWNFAGSLTLRAFEERCHLARSVCGKTTPDTPRTSRSEGLGFLHLALYSPETGPIALLISDRSGEFYTGVADSVEDCGNLHEVSRADFVLILVDGEKLASEERHGVKGEVILMIRALIEGGVLTKSHRVGIVLTKYDIVRSSSFSDRAERDFDQLVQKVRERFSPSLAEIQDFRIAARPENETVVPPRFGVLGIIEECMHAQRFDNFEPAKKVQIGRWFLRLQIRNGAK